MGLWSTLAGWFGGTGVKALLWKYSEPLKRSAPVITGAVLLILTPIARVIISVYAFAVDRDYKYVAVTSAVLFVMALTVVLGLFGLK